MDQNPIDVYAKACDAKELASCALFAVAVCFVAWIAIGCFETSRIARLEHIEGIDHLGRTVRKIQPDTRLEDAGRGLDQAKERIRFLDMKCSNNEILIRSLIKKLELLEEKHGAKTQ